MILDISSRVVFLTPLAKHQLIPDIICRCYLVSLCLTSLFALNYTITDIYDSKGITDTRIRKYIYRILFFIFCAAIFFLPLNHEHTDTVYYVTGPAAIFTFCNASLVILSVLSEVVIHRDMIKKKRRTAITAWLVLWLISATIQFFNPQLSIISFSSCIGVLIIFFEIENPEAALSRRTGHFSSAVIRDYFDYLYVNKINVSLTMISFNTIGDSTQDSENIRKEINTLSDYLFSIPKAKIFDTAEGYFILVYKTPEENENGIKLIKQYFRESSTLQSRSYAINLLNPFFTIVSDYNIATNSDELLSIISENTPASNHATPFGEIHVNEETITSLREKKRREDMVIAAMEDDRIEVFYQPIYNVKTGKFASAEALVRIRLQNGTLVYPNDFIPIIEESGRIIPLSNAIYKKAFSFMKNYHLERLGIDYIELNLSVKHGNTSLFASQFNSLLEQFSIPANMINLEITETSALNNKENMLTNMKQLSQCGITFSLDDFGSGSSNLNYIIDMPISTVKVDKSLTDAYFKSDKANAILKAVVNMTHSIGIRMVAEGVETKEQLTEMTSLGIDYIQGYYFAKPLCEREFLAFLQKNNL